MATIVNCDDSCDLGEIMPNTNFDGGRHAGVKHYCGMETKALEASPLLRFDFSAEVPNGDTITAASLFLYETSYQEQVGLNIEDYTFLIYKCLRVWPTDEATWNIWKAANNWTTAGADGHATDVDKNVNASYTGPNFVNTWVEIDVLDLVNDVQGNGQILNISMDGNQALVGEEDFLYWRFSSYGAEANQPYLSITHEGEPPAGASRNQGHIYCSRLGLPSLPDGWRRRRGLLVPTGV